jgi:hypothetical protein
MFPIRLLEWGRLQRVWFSFWFIALITNGLMDVLMEIGKRKPHALWNLIFEDAYVSLCNL